jgi:hypothetical protein
VSQSFSVSLSLSLSLTHTHTHTPTFVSSSINKRAEYSSYQYLPLSGTLCSIYTLSFLKHTVSSLSSSLKTGTPWVKKDASDETRKYSVELCKSQTQFSLYPNEPGRVHWNKDDPVIQSFLRK